MHVETVTQATNEKTLLRLANDSRDWTPEQLQKYILEQEQEFFGKAPIARKSTLDAFGAFKFLFSDGIDYAAAERARNLFDTVRAFFTVAQNAIIDAARQVGAWSASEIVPFTVSTVGKRKGAPMKRQSVAYHMKKIEAILLKNVDCFTLDILA